MTVDGQPAHVWSWWGHDSEVCEQLVFVTAARRTDLPALRRRTGIAEPHSARRLRPTDPGYAAALARPARLLWMPLDRFAARSHTWFDEEQLTVARRASTGTRPSTPGHHNVPG